MFALLFRAELLKIGRRRTTVALVAFALLAGPVAALSLGAIAALSESGLPGDVYRSLVYPYSFSTASRSVVMLGKYLSAAAVAVVFGAEFASRAWKMLLPRATHRLPFLAVKDVLLVLGVGVAIAAAVAGWVGCGAVVSALVAPPADFFLEEEVPKYALPSTSASILLVASLSMLLYGALTAFVTIVARSAVAGLVAGTIGPSVLSFFPSDALGFVLPDAHLDNIFGRIVEYEPLISRATRHLGRETATAESFAILFAYILALIVVSHLVFVRRDEH